MVHSQTVGLDEFIARWIGRLRRRPYTGRPNRLWPSTGYDCARGRYPALRAPAVIRESLQGKYARFASRFAAFAADMGVSAGVDMLTWPPSRSRPEC
jgi:hypothetical protein